MDDIVGGLPAVTAALQGDLDALAVHVAPEHALDFAKVLRAESALLAENIHLARGQTMVGEPGLDPVSAQAAPLYNAKITALIDSYHTYAVALAHAADHVAQSAKAYDSAEQHIAASFTRHQPRTPPPTQPSDRPPS